MSLEIDDMAMENVLIHLVQGPVDSGLENWSVGTLIPGWRRDAGRESASSIASNLRAFCNPIGHGAHQRHATPIFGSPAYTYSGTGSPADSEPDLRDLVRFPSQH
jgi:hypothetical protein